MDFVAFETFTDSDVLPSPQPSLSLPLKPSIGNLSAKLPNLSNLSNLKNLLKHPLHEEGQHENSEDLLAQKYASLSLTGLRDQPENASQSRTITDEPEKVAFQHSDTLSMRLERAFNLGLSDATLRELFTGVESKLTNLDDLVEAGIDGLVARKMLRGHLESDLLKSFSTVLSEYSKPAKALKQLGEKLDSLHDLIEDTNRVLTQDVQRAEPLRGEVSTFAQEKLEVDMRKQILSAFKAKFTLNEYERFVLISGNIDADFFAAVASAEKIHEACTLLLAMDNPKMGKDIMASVGELLRHANNTIITFCNKTLANLYVLSNRERVTTLQLCLAHLKLRPAQLEDVVTSFIKSRSTALNEDFASQVGGNGVDSETMELRPIYYSSHDPVRFITDLLAYIHSVSVNEAELVASLLGSELAELVEEVNIKSLASLVKPLRSQLSKVVVAESQLVTLNQMFNNLEMYLLMFSRMKNAEAISATIVETSSMISENILLLLTNKLASIRESSAAKIELSTDLQPPEWLIFHLTDIISIVDSMRGDSVLGLSDDKSKEFLRLAVDEPWSIFEQHLTLIAVDLTKRETIIFKLNFLDYVVSKIIPFSYFGDKMLELNIKIGELGEDLKNIQLQHLLSECSSYDLYNVMNMICTLDPEIFDVAIYAPITENKVFCAEQIAEVDTTVQEILPTAFMDLQLSLMKLNNPVVSNNVINSTSSKFAEFYGMLDELVNEYLNIQLTWTKAEVEALLGVDSLYDEATLPSLS